METKYIPSSPHPISYPTDFFAEVSLHLLKIYFLRAYCPLGSVLVAGGLGVNEGV